MTGPSPETTVTTEVDLRLVLGSDRALTVPATFDYDPREPFAVAATFGTSEGDVRWIFSRELLDEGLRRPTGEGDVAVWPSRSRGADIVCVSLSSPSGQALLEADAGVMADFLRRSYLAVPAGTEATLIDLDAELAALLSTEGDPTGY